MGWRRAAGEALRLEPKNIHPYHVCSGVHKRKCAHSCLTCSCHIVSLSDKSTFAHLCVSASDSQQLCYICKINKVLKTSHAFILSDSFPEHPESWIPPKQSTVYWFMWRKEGKKKSMVWCWIPHLTELLVIISHLVECWISRRIWSHFLTFGVKQLSDAWVPTLINSLCRKSLDALRSIWSTIAPIGSAA